MPEVKEEKLRLRKVMFGLRNSFDKELKAAYDLTICDKLIAMVDNRKAKTIHVYLPILSEIDIYPFIRYCLDAGLRVVAPKTLPKRKLENRILYSLEHLETGIMGTKHPAEPILFNGEYDFIVVPGMAFDKYNYRLGYGGGYYDNFIVTHPEAYTLGIYYPFQQVPAVPREAHDCALSSVLFLQD